MGLSGTVTKPLRMYPKPFIECSSTFAEVFQRHCEAVKLNSGSHFSTVTKPSQIRRRANAEPSPSSCRRADKEHSKSRHSGLTNPFRSYQRSIAEQLWS